MTARSDAADAGIGSSASITVIVCAFTPERTALTFKCVDAVLAQDPPPLETILVVDHNAELRRVFEAHFEGDARVTVLENEDRQGLSGARNTGISRARGELVAFLDDDAVPRPGWLSGMVRGFSDKTVHGVGGKAVADWEAGKPEWFPDPFLWVVGCSFKGQPRSGIVRNPIGCNMAFRRVVFEMAGMFDTKVGRIGNRPLGCEETELCIRAAAHLPGAKFELIEDAEITHWVPRARGTWSYLLRRCFYEGVSKALIRTLHDPRSLGTESKYVTRTLSREVAGALVNVVTGPQRHAAAKRTAAVIAGLGCAVAGYGAGRVLFALKQPRRGTFAYLHSAIPPNAEPPQLELSGSGLVADDTSTTPNVSTWSRRSD